MKKKLEYYYIKYYKLGVSETLDKVKRIANRLRDFSGSISYNDFIDRIKLLEEGKERI